jgi:hypothetical protein
LRPAPQPSSPPIVESIIGKRGLGPLLDAAMGGRLHAENAERVGIYNSKVSKF